MSQGADIAYLLRRAIPDALDPIVRRAVGDVLPRLGEGDRYRIAYSGTFSSRVAADLLAFGRNQHLDGALIVIDSDTVRAIYYHGGRVVGAASDLLFERLGRILHRGELIDEATATRMTEKEEVADLAAAAAMVAPETAKWGIETRVWDIVAALFLVHSAHFILIEGEPKLGAVPALDLSPTDLALEGLRRYDEWRHGASEAPRPARRAPETRPPEPKTSKPAGTHGTATDEFLERLRTLY